MIRVHQYQEHRPNPTQAIKQELCVNDKGDERQLPFTTYFLHSIFIIFKSNGVQTARIPDMGSFTSLMTIQDSALPPGAKAGLLPQQQGLPRVAGNAALSCLQWVPPCPVDLVQSSSVNLHKRKKKRCEVHDNWLWG